MSASILPKGHDILPVEQAPVRSRADAFLDSLLWKCVLVSLFMPSFSPILVGTMRPPLSMFLVPLAALFQPIQWPRRIIWLLGWGGWVFISYLVNDGKTTSFLVYGFFIFTIVVFYSALAGGSDAALRRTYRLVVLLGVANALIGIAESRTPAIYEVMRRLNTTSFYSLTENTGGWIGDGSTIRAAVLCMEPGFYAAIQSLIIPLAFAVMPAGFYRRCIWLGVTLLPIAASIYVSFGRTGWLALAAGGATFGLYHLMAHWKFAIRFALVAIAVGLATHFNDLAEQLHLVQPELDGMDYSIQERMFSIVNGVQFAADNPLLGIGCGNVGKMAGIVDTGEFGWPPSILNMYVNMAAETGLVGAALLAAFLVTTAFDVSLGRRAARPGSSAALASLFILLFVWVNLPDLRMNLFGFIVAMAAAGGASSPATAVLSASRANPVRVAA